MVDSAENGGNSASENSLYGSFRMMRHNVNNALFMISSAAELIKLKPDEAVRFADQILDQQERIEADLRGFLANLEEYLDLDRD
jgi:nitrogen-specific signal transduction histidine kinase